MIEILNICPHQNSIVIKFFKILKIREIFCENPRIIFVLFYDVHKENMFTINLGDGREAPSKARKKGAKRLEFLVFNIIELFTLFILKISARKRKKNINHKVSGFKDIYTSSFTILTTNNTYV